jgi:Uma2 family endonuclease
MEAVVEQLLQSPRFGRYVREMTDAWEREQETRRQFREGLNEDTKAEFINGKTIVHSPASDRHNNARNNLFRLLSAFVIARSLGLVRDEKALIGMTRNDYEPDLCFWGTAKAATIAPEQLVYPVPDLVCEVLSPSTDDRDRGVKFEDYATHGVGEYWMIDPVMRTVEQYRLHDGRFELHRLVTGGTIASIVVAGFEIPHESLFDEAENLKALRRLLADNP